MKTGRDNLGKNVQFEDEVRRLSLQCPSIDAANCLRSNVYLAGLIIFDATLSLVGLIILEFMSLVDLLRVYFISQGDLIT